MKVDSSVTGALVSANAGIQRGLEGVSRVANEVANYSAEDSVARSDFAGNLVQLRQYSDQIQAAAKAFSAAQAALDSLLQDIR